jgi:GNAT superfamily N-acetyltransferase
VSVLLAEGVTPELEALWKRALHDVVAKRGGAALLSTLCAATPPEQLLASAVASGSLWVLHDDDVLKGFALCRAQLIEAVYVASEFRRQRVATTIVRHLLDDAAAPVDAYALPGDRAMKSLYESIGWKARLLTMRGA